MNIVKSVRQEREKYNDVLLTAADLRNSYDKCMQTSTVFSVRRTTGHIFLVIKLQTTQK